MKKYKKLFTNSLIFTIGSLGRKLITFLLIPLYTYYLSAEQYGIIDLVLVTSQMLLPIVSVSMYQSILRFSLDKKTDKEKTLTNSLAVSFCSYIFFLFTYPFLSTYNFFGDNLFYLYIILFVQIFEMNFSEYARSTGHVRLFAINGIILSFLIAIFNILFLVIFRKGVSGYFLALFLSYLFSIIFLVVGTRALFSIKLKKIDKDYAFQLIKYAVPLMPNTLIWWVINTSSRYFITYFLGLDANGIFAISSKIPALLSMIDQIFNQAWQLSAISEYDTEFQDSFFSNVFEVFAIILFICVSGIIVFIKQVYIFLFSPEYYIGWQTTVFLLISSLFSAFSGFIGTNYVASKKTSGVLKTSILGGAVSIILNLLLIPICGLVGAAFSSAISFFVMFVIRYLDTQSFVRISINWGRFSLSMLMIFLQISILFNDDFSTLIGTVMNFGVFLLLLFINTSKLRSFVSSLF